MGCVIMLSSMRVLNLYRTIIFPVVLYGCENLVADIERGKEAEGV